MVCPPPLLCCAVVSTLLLGGPAHGDPVPAEQTTSPAQAAAVDRARSATKQLGAELKSQLMGAMSTGGPPAALKACATMAQAITTRRNKAPTISVGRASLRLRNPENSGPAWVQAWLQAQGEREAKGTHPIAHFYTGEGGQEVARLIVPISVQAPCLMCHGPKESLAPDIRTALSSQYPNDKAIGYKLGDLRGVMWAESPVTTP